MEVRIKLTVDEVKALCLQRCESLTPAPKGKRWDVTLTRWDGATCELEEIAAPTPAPVESLWPDPVPIPEPIAVRADYSNTDDVAVALIKEEEGFF